MPDDRIELPRTDALSYMIPRRKNRLTGDPPRLTHNSQLFAVFDLNHNQPLMLSIAAKVKDVVSSIFS